MICFGNTSLLQSLSMTAENSLVHRDRNIVMDRRLNAYGTQDNIPHNYPLAIEIGLRTLKTHKELSEYCDKNPDLADIHSEASFSAILFMYSTLSGRSIKTLEDEGVLAPALLLYHSLAVSWDDIIDQDGFEFNSQSSEFAWSNKLGNVMSPQEMFDKGRALLINLPWALEDDELNVVSIYENTGALYRQSEVKINEMSKCGNKFNLEEAIKCRENGFGRLARSVATILNGKNGNSPLGVELERKAENFALAVAFEDEKIDFGQKGECGVATSTGISRDQVGQLASDYWAKLGDKYLAGGFRDLYRGILWMERLRG